MKTLKQAIALMLVALFSAGAMTAYQAGADEGKSKSTCVSTVDYNSLTPEQYSEQYNP